MSVKHVLENGEAVRHRARVHWSYDWPRLGLPNRSQTLLITDNAVVLCQGLFARRIDRISYAHIESEATYSSFLGRILGFGHLQLTVSGGDKYQFGHLARIDLVRNALAIGMSQADGKSTIHPQPQGPWAPAAHRWGNADQ